MENTNQGNSQSKLPKLTAFKTTRKNFDLIGIDTKLVTQSNPLNGKILIGFLLISSCCIFISVHVFNHAETFSEFTQSIYAVSTGILMASTLVIIVLKVDKLFEYIKLCDNTLNTSE